MWYLRQLILATCPLLGQGHVPIGGNILVSLYLEPLVLTDAGGGTTVSAACCFFSLFSTCARNEDLN